MALSLYKYQNARSLMPLTGGQEKTANEAAEEQAKSNYAGEGYADDFTGVSYDPRYAPQNSGNYSDAEDYWNQTGSKNPENYGQYWENAGVPPPGVAKSADDWEAIRQSFLGMPGAPMGAMQRARDDYGATRDAQMAGLGLLSGQKSPADLFATGARNEMMQEVARGGYRGALPFLALRKGGQELAQGTAKRQVADEHGRQMQLQKNSLQMRAADLARAETELKTLDGDLEFQRAKEQLALEAAQMNEKEQAAYRSGLLDIAGLGAGSDPRSPLWQQLLPGLTTAVSHGLGALGTSNSDSDGETGDYPSKGGGYAYA